MYRKVDAVLASKRQQESEDIYTQQKQQMGSAEPQGPRKYYAYKKCTTVEDAFDFARSLGISSPWYVGIDIDLINYIHEGLVEYANNMTGQTICCYAYYP